MNGIPAKWDPGLSEDPRPRTLGGPYNPSDNLTPSISRVLIV